MIFFFSLLLEDAQMNPACLGAKIPALPKMCFGNLVPICLDCRPVSQGRAGLLGRRAANRRRDPLIREARDKKTGNKRL